MSGKRDRRWAAAAALSLAVHAGLLLALRLAPATPIRTPVLTDEPPPVLVSLLPPPQPPLPEAPGGAAGPPAPTPAPAPPKPEPPKPKPKPEVKAPPKPKLALHEPKAKPPPTVRALPAAPAPEADPGPDPASIVTASELASATTAGGGGGGGSGSGSGTGDGAGAGARCDMVQRLQAALRSDPDLRAAAYAAQRGATDPRAIRIWKGDWIQGQGQSGKGLAGLRQAIMVEVGFAPEACRNQPVRGLVLITFGDGPGAPKIALGGGNGGAGAWRWTDLLGRNRVAGRS